MKNLFIFFILLTSSQVSSQELTTFEIETLTKPEKFLNQEPSSEVFKYLKADIEKSSKLPDSIVTFGEHPFLTGILTAYREHRPFVISPDIVWLLISQGFARHISNNSKEFRNQIVNFENKKLYMSYLTISN